MIHARIRKQGNSMVVTIPKDAMERYALKEGDEIGFLPTRYENVPQLDAATRATADRLFDEYKDVFAYLAER